MTKYIFIALTLLMSPNLFAHYLWIEANPSGKAGEKQTVKIFYGEYENRKIEEAGKRLEEVNGLIAWIMDPSGEKINLELVKKENHFLAEFSPLKTGRYEILVMNNVREVVDWSAYDIGVIKPVYYSRQLFYAFDSKIKVEKIVASSLPSLDLDLLPVYKNAPLVNYYPIGKPIRLTVFSKGKELPKGKLMVYAPNGWMKELEQGDDGLFSFTPLEKGQYIVECIYKEKTSGTFNEKKYEAIRHRITLTLLIR